MLCKITNYIIIKQESLVIMSSALVPNNHSDLPVPLEYRWSHPRWGKLFSWSKTLKDHSRIHTGERPYECAIWGQTFSQYSSLQKHGRVHDKKQPYKWDYDGWGKAFSQISNLIRHKRIHTGEKPYKCSICPKSFASGSNLKQHIQTHANLDIRLTYYWKYCKEGTSKPYYYYSSLRKHIQAYHKSYARKVQNHFDSGDAVMKSNRNLIIIFNFFYKNISSYKNNNSTLNQENLARCFWSKLFTGMHWQI